ncbi:type I polyketide synthase [Streptomyces murinus]|uniref:Phosphopantetheine--protein transferase-like protein n=1 Tax=Streptomyces murinus TaxID=33900 RepID=A0A7W3NKR6_STRMR|nr:type I polyketide synthase [Streptomyces murinus]MBA9052311.1 phosphopantetheine--protein transferase-like protein [Streptomyces murinus]UWW93557.1 4'-phosphopantetheinyl transferase superfamily protein [Streptomyces murinus]
MTNSQLPVAIVGMAVLLPGARGLDAYWHNLRSGVDAIGEVPAGRWDADYYRPAAAGPVAPDQVYCRRGGFVDGLAEVEVTRYGIMPAAVYGTEPDQLIALDVAAAALADAGGEHGLPARDRIGVILGRGGYLTPGLARLDQRVRTAGQLVRTLGELVPDLSSAQLDRVRAAFTERLGPDRPEAAIGLVPNLAASRIANRLDLRGPAYTVDAACASSLVAVDQAVGELTAGRCDMMLAGGVHHCHDITLWSVFSQLRALSPTERIRPFHRDADGILIGEGTGVVVLKRLADAERDGDRVYAVIRGTGVAGDGRTAGLVSPDPGGQTRAVRQAWRAAGLDPAAPRSLGLLEAHGTATPAGDGAELTTLAEVFGPGSGLADEERPVLGSVKSMIGHTMPAAGVAGLVKAALALHHATLLPTLHCDDPHPRLGATRFRTLAQARPWDRDPGEPTRRAAVNAFGFGGINAHVVLEEAPAARRVTAPGHPPAPAPVARVAEPERVLLLAADSVERLAALLDADDSAVLAAGLDPARAHPGAGPARLGIVAPNTKRLALARRAAEKGRAWQGRSDVWLRPTPLLGGPADRLAFVFPGLEGEFTPPRTDDIAAHFGLPAPQDTRAETGVGARAGSRVEDIGRHGLDVVGVGRLLDRALRAMGVVPDAVAGHSVGEWTAMAAAGIYSPGQVDGFMAEFDPDALTVPGLAFAAIGTSAAQVGAALADAWAGSGIVLSHDNAPRQSMVCGPDSAVEDLVRSFRAQGVICQVLPFRSGFHTPMLEPYLAPIQEAADRFRLHPPTVPVWSGTTARPFPAAESAVRALFVRHLLEPVRFRELTEALYAAGHRVFVQPGPGRLTSLIDDTLGDRDHLAVPACSPHHDGLPQLRRVATALWAAGAAVVPDLTGAPATRPTPAAIPTSATPAILVNPAGIDRPPVRLDLGGALVSLDSAVLEELRGELGRRPAMPRPVASGASTADGLAASGAPAFDGFAASGTPAFEGFAASGATALDGLAASGATALDGLAARFPVAAELSALLRDTADTAAEVMAAGGRTPAVRPRTPTAHPRPPHATPPAPDVPAAVPPASAIPASVPPASAVPAAVPPAPAAAVATRASGIPAAVPRASAVSAAVPPAPAVPPSAPPAPAVPPASAPEASTTTTLHISPRTMPHLLDHCFYPQRPGWPDLEDRWPVVPATTIVRHMMDAAEAAEPGMRAVAVHGARFERWLTAVPAVDVPITVTPVPGRPHHLAVAFGPTARAVLELAPHHPAPPPPAPRPDAPERRPEHTAAQIYRERWMFHGPGFQGLTELSAIGERHVRGVITAPAAPGALLDNVGQLLGYWIMATRTERTVVFPVQMRRMTFHGPHPAPGTPVDCLVRITSLTDTLLEADAQLTVGGRVWAVLDGWQDRRFDNDPTTRPVERFPERHTLSAAQPGGWTLLHERWPDLASRELIMRNSLGSAERAQYAAHPPRGRRQWLLGRIAVKDAVRRWLWEQGEGPVFPAEIRVHNDQAGRPCVTGVHGRTLPPLDVSLAHRAEAGVALVRPRGPHPGPADTDGTGVGIDIEEVVARESATLATALGPAELRLLRAQSGPEAEWFTRFWAAKEAVAKAEGTGFGGRPRDFRVLEASPDGSRLLVSGRLAAAYPVHCAQAANPPALAPRAYVVAWTTGPATASTTRPAFEAAAPHDPAAEETPR